MIVFEILGAILQPNANVVLGRFADEKWIVITAQPVFPGIGLIVGPLNAGKAAHVREHAAELIRLLPGDIERADAARRNARDRPAICVAPDIVFRLNIRQDLVTQKLGLGFRTANGLVFGVERVAIVWLGALLILDSAFSVGMLFAFMAYKDQFSARVAGLIDKMIELRDGTSPRFKSSAKGLPPRRVACGAKR